MAKLKIISNPYKKEIRYQKWQENAYDYVSFNDCIGKLLDDNDIHIPFRRRKFDHFLWYANR